MRKSAWILGTLVLGLLGGMLAGGFAYAGRNSSGTYSNVSGPFVPGTTITSASFNNQFSDYATALTESLSRTGQGGMLAPLRGVDGSVTAPAVSFTNETGTGLYRIGASNPAMSVAGVKRQEWTSAGTLITGSASVSNGFTLSGSNATLSEAATQSLWKTNGALQVGSFDNNDVSLMRNNSAVLTLSSSGPAFTGKPTATATVGGDGATTLTTKGYVDTALALKAPLASPTFTGTVTVPALSGAEASTVAANKGYVDSTTSAVLNKQSISATNCTAGGATIFTFNYASNSKIRFDGAIYVSLGGGTLYVGCTLPVGGVGSFVIFGEGATGATVNPAAWTASDAGTGSGTYQVGTSAAWNAPGAILFHGYLYQNNGGASGTVTCKCINSTGALSVAATSYYAVHVDG